MKYKVYPHEGPDSPAVALLVSERELLFMLVTTGSNNVDKVCTYLDTNRHHFLDTKLSLVGITSPFYDLKDAFKLTTEKK